MADRGLCEANVTADTSLIINDIHRYWHICHYFWQLLIFYIDIVCVLVVSTELAEQATLKVHPEYYTSINEP